MRHSALRNELSVALAILAASLLLSSCSGGKDSISSTHVGPPANLTIVSGDAQSGEVGKELPQPLVVKVVDANGNPVAGQVVNFRVAAGGGSVFAGTANTNADGVAQERWTLGTTAGADQTVEARAVDSHTGQALVFGTFHATSTAGAGTALQVVTQPGASVRAGQPLSPQPVVRLSDKYGNAAQQSGVNVTASLVNAGNQSLAGTTTVATSGSGVATFSNLSISGSVGKVTLSFAAPGLTAATSSELTIASGPAATLAAVSATAITGIVGRPVTPVPSVAVKDASGNAVAGVSVQFAVANAGGSISPASVVSDASGVASLSSWTLPAAVGTYSVIATVSELPNASVTFSAAAQAGAAANLTVVSGDNTTATVGTDAPPLVVKITDAGGNSVSGAQVSWSVSSGGGELRSTTTTTNKDGIATDTVRVGTASGVANVVTANAGGGSARFTITSTAGAPATLTKQAGDNRTASAGTAISPAPSVLVADSYGNPVSNATVTFAIASGGGSVTDATRTTNAQGVATVGKWTLGPVGGVTNTLTATVGAITAAFTATSTNPLQALVTSPSDRQNSGSTLSVVVHLTSTVTPAQITAVTASTDGRQVSLTATGTTGDWSATLDLTGLATGQKTLTVSAADAYGNSAAVSQNFFYSDAPPTLTVDPVPVDGSVYSQFVPLHASCQDDSPHCVVSVTARKVVFNQPATVVASAEGVVNQSFGPLQPYEGLRMELVFTATDSYGHVVSQKRSIFVESSPHLTTVYNVPGTIVDAGGDRILYLQNIILNRIESDSTGQLAIRHRTDGRDEVIGVPGSLHRAANLTPTGALVMSPSTVSLTDWRNGTAIGLGNSGSAIASADNPFVVYSSNAFASQNSLVLRDEMQGVSTPVHSPSGGASEPLATTGEFLYSAPSGSTYSTIPIYRYLGGTSTLFTIDTACHKRPAYDGHLAVYAIDHCGPFGDPQSLVLNDGGVETVLFAPAQQSFAYYVKNGWVLIYQASLGNNGGTVWARTPTGTMVQITTAATSLFPEAAGPAGQLVYTTGNRRYVAVPTGSAYTITDIGNSTLGTPFWIGGQLYVAIGGTLMQVSY